MNIDIDKIFSDLPEVSHENYPDLFKDRVRFFIEEIERFRSKIGKSREAIRILDVACGVGKNSLAFAHTGYQVLGIDNGKESLEYLDRVNSFANLQTRWFDLYDTDFDSLPGGYDVIVVAAILEHLENPGLILRKLLERAAPSCLVLGDLPNGYGAAEWTHWLRKKVRGMWGGTKVYQKVSESLRYKRNYDETDSVTLTDTPHVHDFSWPMLKSLLRDQGLESTRIRNVDFLIGTPVIQKIFFGTKTAQRMDVALAQILPRWLANGWFFSGIHHRSPTVPQSGLESSTGR